MPIFFQSNGDIAAEKIDKLEDTVEILLEQIETLKLELKYKNQKLKSITEELNYTNQELCIVNELLTDSLEQLPSNEAGKLDNNLLINKKTCKKFHK